MHVCPEIKELHRRLRLREQMGDFFVLEEYQKPFYNSKAKFQIIHAGNRGGKTKIAAKKFCDIMTHRHPSIYRPGSQQGRIVAPTYKIMKKSILPLMEEFLPKVNLKYGSFEESYNKQDSIIYLKDEGTIQLMSYEQSVDAFRSVPLDILWNDEQGPVEIFDENIARLGDKSGLCINSLTPEKGATFIHSRYTCRAKMGSDIELFTFDVLQNIHIDREFQIRSLSLMPEKKFRIKMFGDVISMHGLIFDEFDPRIHVIPPFQIPDSWQLFFGFDLGWNNPSAILFFAIGPDQKIYLIEERYVTHETLSQTAGEINRIIASRYPHLDFRFGVIDARSGGATSRQTGETDYRKFCRALRRGPIYLSSRSSRAVLNRNDCIHDLLIVNPETQESQLQVFSNCRHTIDEFGKYSTKEASLDETKNVNEKPEDKDDHCMSALGFFAERRPKYLEFYGDRLEVPDLSSSLHRGGII